MEKPQLVNFIAKVMEESGFKVYKDFKTSQRVIDIYCVLSTIIGDFGVVVACKNYDKQWEVGIDILKEMEMIGRSLKASKVVIVTSSSFSSQSRNYASRKAIKLIDRDNLMILAKKFSKGASLATEHNHENRYEKTSNEENNENSIDYDVNDSNETEYEYTSDEIYFSNDNHYNNHKNVLTSKSDLKMKNPKNLKSNHLVLNKKKINKPVTSLSSRLKIILNNTAVLILLIVAISYLLSYALEIVVNVPKGISGLVKILSSLLLSYGLVFAFNKEGTAILLKGTIVFFVSLVFLILMIIFL